MEMDGAVEVDKCLIKIDVAEGKRNDRGGGFDRRGRGGSSSGSGFKGRDSGRSGYGDDFDSKSSYSSKHYTLSHLVIIELQCKFCICILTILMLIMLH